MSQMGLVAVMAVKPGEEKKDVMLLHGLGGLLLLQ